MEDKKNSLVIGITRDEILRVGDEVEIEVGERNLYSNVRLFIRAPKHVKIQRIKKNDGNSRRSRQDDS